MANVIKLQEKKRPKRGEIGAINRNLFGQLADSEYLRELTWPNNIKVYDKMRRSDAQVQALLLVLELPIRSARWYVEPYSNSSKDKQIAEFIEENLFSGPPLGMTVHWDDFLRLALSMFAFGHSIFEKVYEVDDDGYVKWRKFAERPQDTIHEFYYDEVGGPEYIEQWLSAKGKVKIPIDDLLVFTYRKEKGDLRGISVLRAVYKHWFIKDFLYRITNIGLERNLVGTPVLTLPEQTQDGDDEVAQGIVTSLRSGEEAGVTLPHGWVLDLFEGKRNISAEVMSYIEHHDLMIVRAGLAQFLNLGSKEVGSFALSKDQSDLFLMSLNASANYVANTINSYAIPQLVDYNWDVEGYPKLKHDPIGGQDHSKLINGVKALVDGKVIVPDTDLEGFMRDLMGLPEKAKDANQPTGQANQVQASECGCSPHHERVTLAEGERKWRRDLTTYEKRINLAEIERKWDTVEKQFVDQGKELGQKQIAALVQEIQKLAEAGQWNKIAELEVKYQGEAAKFIKAFLADLVDFGADQAAEELKIDKPGISRETRQQLDARAALVAGLMASRLKARVGFEFLNQLAGGATVKEAAYRAKQAGESVLETDLAGHASAQVNYAVNKGRDLAAEKAKAQLAQYSAILDERVCPLCEWLDGRIIELDNPDFDRFTPPIHNNCRCIWAYVLPDEEPQPEVTWETPPPNLVEQFGNLVS